jgi:multiple sugar transport system substrate-binding protein
MGAKSSLLLLALACVLLGLLRSERVLPGAAGGDVVELTFWNGFTGPDGRTMLELVRQFNQSNPDVRVTMQRIAWATYYNKLMVSAVDGRGPETFVIQSALLPRMQRAGFLDIVDDLYGPRGELKADFSQQLLKIVDYGHGSEQFVGLPLDVWPQGMYCNTELLKRAGLVNADGTPHPPRDRDEFLKAAAAMKIEGAGGQVDQWGWGFGAWENNFMSLVPQFGGEYFDAKGEPTLDHPGNVQALQFLTDLLQQRHLAPPPEGGVAGWVGFRQGKVGMVFDGIYMVGDLKRLEGLSYMGAPLPQVGPFPGTNGDSHVLCIRKGLPPRTREASARFLRFISDHSLDWADAGQVPARRSVRESEAFKKLQVQYAFSQQLEYVKYPPRTPSIGEFQLHINLAVEQAIRGRATPADALHQANEDFKRYLEVDRKEREFLGGAKASQP